MNKQRILTMLRQQGFSEKIIKAFKNVKREDFIPQDFKLRTYEDTALPIGFGQTISQPYTIAFMFSLLNIKPKKKQRILEVGSGSGYVLALINEISKGSELYGIEFVKELAERSRKVLKDKKNIKIVWGDGSKGFPGKRGFDRILVSASANELPKRLVKQLKIGGIMVAPVRNSIVFLQRHKNKNKIKEFPGFRFVPLVERK